MSDLQRGVGSRGTFECVADYVSMGIIGLMIAVSTLRLRGLVW
jgi:hypothetical protein